jgi:hypothetical protein
MEGREGGKGRKGGNEGKGGCQFSHPRTLNSFQCLGE